MPESLNSEAGRGPGMQSTPDRQASVSGQGQGHVGGSVSSRMRKQMTETYALTAGQREMALKPKKGKAGKSKGVKAPGLGETKPGSAPNLGKVTGEPHILLEPKTNPEDT